MKIILWIIGAIAFVIAGLVALAAAIVGWFAYENWRWHNPTAQDVREQFSTILSHDMPSSVVVTGAYRTPLSLLSSNFCTCAAFQTSLGIQSLFGFKEGEFDHDVVMIKTQCLDHIAIDNPDMPLSFQLILSKHIQSEDRLLNVHRSEGEAFVLVEYCAA